MQSSGSRVQRVLLLLVAVMGTLALLEAGLRLYGFEFHPYPVVQFGWPDPATIEQVYQADPDLLWVERDYGQKLNAARRHAPFVVFMGDSCTEFGTYPHRTLEQLSRRAGSPVAGISLGTGGWTAVQGSWQLDRDVLPLHPRVVTIYFGWNDHWMALGPPDADLPRVRWLSWLADRVRLVQLIEKAHRRVRAPEHGALRVDVGRYEATLESMVARIHGQGGEAILVTAPSGHERGHEPRYLQQRHLSRLEDLVPLHQQYVDATRRAARESGAVLCDAAEAFASLPGPRQRYFKRDGIHLTADGDAEMARLLSGCIEGAGLLPH